MIFGIIRILEILMPRKPVSPEKRKRLTADIRTQKKTRFLI
jgi:hypothetical protein